MRYLKRTICLYILICMVFVTNTLSITSVFAQDNINLLGSWYTNNAMTVANNSWPAIDFGDIKYDGTMIHTLSYKIKATQASSGTVSVYGTAVASFGLYIPGQGFEGAYYKDTDGSVKPKFSAKGENVEPVNTWYTVETEWYEGFPNRYMKYTIKNDMGNILAQSDKIPGIWRDNWDAWDTEYAGSIMSTAVHVYNLSGAIVQIKDVAVTERKMKFEGYANVDFNNSGKKTGLSLLWFENVETEREGRKGVILNHDSEAKRYLYIDIDDNMLYDIPDDTPIEVTVDYFDEGEGFFELLYDAYGIPENIRNGIEGREECIRLTNTMEWKTHTFYVERMRLANRLGNFDVRIGVYSVVDGFSPEPVIVGSVTLKTVERQNPIRLESVGGNKAGNIYAKGEDIKVNLNIANKTERDARGDFTYTAKDEDGYTVYEGKVSGVFPANKTTPLAIKTTAGKYGIYTLSVNGEFRYTDRDSEPLPFSVNTEYSLAWEVSKDNINDSCGTALLINSNKMSAPNGVAAGIAARAGVRWNREEILWKDSEPQPGVYKIPEHMKRELELARDAGMNNELGLLYANPVIYDNVVGMADAPTTEKELKAYGDWCEWLARETKGLVQAFCVWNEYNGAFNEQGESPEHYVKMLEIAYKAVKKGNPDAIVIGLETAGIDPAFNKRVFEAGGLQYMDVAGVHPYDWTGHFDTQRIVNLTNDMKAMMREYGDEKAIWWTEFGFSSHYTFKERMFNHVMTYALQKHYDLADVVIQFRMQDYLEGGSVEGNWGYIKDYRDKEVMNCAKPSYLAVCAMNNLIGSKAEAKEVIKDGTTYAFHFYNNEMKKDVVLLQSEYDAQLMSLDLGTNCMEIYDVYGNKLESIESENGVYNFVINKEPLYIVGNISKFEQKGTIKDVKSGLLKDGEFIESFSDLKAGDEIQVKLHRLLMPEEKENIICIQAFYDEEGNRLMMAECEYIVFEEESDYWIGRTVQVPYGTSLIKTFIWNYNSLTSLIRPFILRN